MIGPIRSTHFGHFLALIVAIFGLTAFAHADTSSTRAARLTYIQGSVTVNQPNGGDSVAAQLNLPLLEGVQLVTGNDGQAEVEFEDGSIVRLTPNTALSLDSLAIEPNGDFATNLSLLRGLAYCELRATSQYRYFINASGDILSPVENTTVRINFDQPPAIFSVLDGTAQVERQNAANSGGYQTQIRAGESLSADPRDVNRYFLTQQITQDSWDQWNEDRDQAAANDASGSTAVRNDYAGAQGYGWSDLDANGNWYNVPGQGTVWQPEVAIDDPNFDPYGNGAWVYYPNAGYVWASGYAWGWTPYRCGNWSYYSSFGWAWAPGAGCGSRGWGFAGGGRPVNIIIGPTGYRPPRVPLSGAPHLRPILPVMTTKAWVHSGPRSEDDHRPRQISGVTVQPIQRQHDGPRPGGAGGEGSALRRDFPIDSRTKAPVLGLASTGSTAVRPSETHRPDQLPGSTGSAPYDHAPGQPDTYGGRRYPSNLQPAPGSAASQPQGARPAPPVPDGSNPSPARPALNRYPSASRPTDNVAPSQSPSNQSPSYRRPEDNVAPTQPPSNQNPSYRRRPESTAPNQPQPNPNPNPAPRRPEQQAPPTPQPPVRIAPSPEPPAARPQPPSAERSAPPPPAPSRPSAPPPSPAPAAHPAPAPTPTPGHPSPN